MQIGMHFFGVETPSEARHVLADLMRAGGKSFSSCPDYENSNCTYFFSVQDFSAFQENLKGAFADIFFSLIF